MYFIVSIETDGHLLQFRQFGVSGHDLGKGNTRSPGRDPQCGPGFRLQFEHLGQRVGIEILEKEFPGDDRHFLASHPANFRDVLPDVHSVHGLLNGGRVAGKKFVEHLQCLGIDIPSQTGAHENGIIRRPQVQGSTIGQTPRHAPELKRTRGFRVGFHIEDNPLPLVLNMGIPPLRSHSIDPQVFISNALQHARAPV